MLTGLVLELAGLLNARLDLLDEGGLAAVALEVGQLGAAIGGEGFSEALELGRVSPHVLCVCIYIYIYIYHSLTYRARGHVRELGAGEAGGDEGDEGVGELHLD